MAIYLQPAEYHLSPLRSKIKCVLVSDTIPTLPSDFPAVHVHHRGTSYPTYRLPPLCGPSYPQCFPAVRIMSSIIMRYIP